MNLSHKRKYRPRSTAGITAQPSNSLHHFIRLADNVTCAALSLVMSGKGSDRGMGMGMALTGSTLSKPPWFISIEWQI